LEELQRHEEIDRISYETNSHDIFAPVFSSEGNSLEQRDSVHSNSSNTNNNHNNSDEQPIDNRSIDSLFLLNAQSRDRDEQLKYGMDIC